MLIRYKSTASQAIADRIVDFVEELFGEFGIHFGHCAFGFIANQAPVGSPELVLSSSDLEQHVAGRFEIHRNALINRVDLPHGANQQRRRNGDALIFRFVDKLVFEAVFARDKGCLVIHCHVAAGNGCSGQASQHFGSVGISPTKVIEDGNSIRVCTNCDAVSDRHPR